MREIFIIRPSGRQRLCLLAIYTLAAAVSLCYLRPVLPAASIALLLMLVGWRESHLYGQADALRLEVSASRAGIGVEQGGQSYFYAKYKVYACRWFAILRLIDTHHERTLLLNPDCFPGDDDYRRLRFNLGISSDAD